MSTLKWIVSIECFVAITVPIDCINNCYNFGAIVDADACVNSNIGNHATYSFCQLRLTFVAIVVASCEWPFARINHLCSWDSNLISTTDVNALLFNFGIQRKRSCIRKCRTLSLTWQIIFNFAIKFSDIYKK